MTSETSIEYPMYLLRLSYPILTTDKSDIFVYYNVVQSKSDYKACCGVT